MSDELECEYFDTVGQLRPVKRDMEVQRRNVGTKCYYIMDYDYKIVINSTLTLSPAAASADDADLSREQEDLLPPPAEAGQQARRGQFSQEIAEQF